jgi:thymidylate kinase
MDGAGKSTQIENLRNVASALGLRVRVIAFWDDIVVGTRFREQFVHTVYKSEPGVGRPDKPVERRDKNVHAWYLAVARHLLYLADAINSRLVIRRAIRELDVLVVDRYIYDECASLPLDNAVTRRIINLLRRCAPRPDLAFVLDADPVAARARKPEYPLDFMHRNRANYARLVAMLSELTLIPALPLAQSTRDVESVFRECLGVRDAEREVAIAKERNSAA